MNQETMKTNPEFNFTYLREKLNSSIFPSTSWGYTKGNKHFIGLQKMEKDFRIRKRVAILSNLHVEIYLDNQMMPLAGFITIVSMDHLIALLKSVDEIPLPNH